MQNFCCLFCYLSSASPTYNVLSSFSSGKKSRQRCTFETTLAGLLVDHLMSNVTHDACQVRYLSFRDCRELTFCFLQTAKSHHEKAYCWCAPRGGRYCNSTVILSVDRYQGYCNRSASIHAHLAVSDTALLRYC